MNLPIYEAIIDGEDLGMYAVSLVSNPATESNFLLFSEQDKMQKFSVADEEKRNVFGLIMAANLPIYRVSPDGFEFYLVFKPETLEKMALKFLKNGYQNNTDLEHDQDYIGGIELQQIFIKNTAMGVSPKGFEMYDDGSLFGEYHISDERIWSEIKNGTFKGFSLEAFIDIRHLSEDSNAAMSTDKETDPDIIEIEDLLKEIRKMVLKR